MEYENVYEAVRYKQACENVKKIVNAIKAIRIKYYPNLAKISEEDQKTCQALENKLEQISQEIGLEKLKVALMVEISRYTGSENSISEEDMNDPEKRRKIFEEAKANCCGAIDAGQQAISEGKIKKAIRCQQKYAEYAKIFEGYEEGKQIIETITAYKREKFAELTMPKEKIQENNKEWKDRFKGYLRPKDAQAREDVTKVITELQHEKEIVKEEKGTEEISI